MRGLSVMLVDIRPKLKHCLFAVSYLLNNLPPTLSAGFFGFSFLPTEQKCIYEGHLEST